MKFTTVIQSLAADCQDYYGLLSKLVQHFRPKSVLELGTGTGRSAAAMMAVLPADGMLTTVNWPNPPSGDDVGIELKPWERDGRLCQALGDTRDDGIVDYVGDVFNPPGYGLLFIDSGTTHDFPLIAEEWRLYRPMLTDEAIVCVDDLDFPGGGIRKFWDALPYEKVELPLSQFKFGVFKYKRRS